MQDFTGVCGFSAVNSLMIKRALLVVGFLALCFQVAAQQNNRTDEFDAAAALALYRPEIFTSVDSSLLVRDLPLLTFLDGRLPGSTALGRMGTAPVATLPVALVSAAAARAGVANSSKVARGCAAAAKSDEAIKQTIQYLPEARRRGSIE